MGGSTLGGPTGSVVGRAATILADAGHEDASCEMARVARCNGVSLEQLAAAIIEIDDRRARGRDELADVVRLHWSMNRP